MAAAASQRPTEWRPDVLPERPAVPPPSRRSLGRGAARRAAAEVAAHKLRWLTCQLSEAAQLIAELDAFIARHLPNSLPGEVATRLLAIRPTVERLVQPDAPPITGDQRLWRNVAAHATLPGLNVMAAPSAELRRVQRGGRKGSARTYSENSSRQRRRRPRGGSPTEEDNDTAGSPVPEPSQPEHCATCKPGAANRLKTARTSVCASTPSDADGSVSTDVGDIDLDVYEFNFCPNVLPDVPVQPAALDSLAVVAAYCDDDRLLESSNEVPLQLPPPAPCVLPLAPLPRPPLCPGPPPLLVAQWAADDVAADIDLLLEKSDTAAMRAPAAPPVPTEPAPKQPSPELPGDDPASRAAPPQPALDRHRWADAQARHAGRICEPESGDFAGIQARNKRPTRRQRAAAQLPADSVTHGRSMPRFPDEGLLAEVCKLNQSLAQLDQMRSDVDARKEFLPPEEYQAFLQESLSVEASIQQEVHDTIHAEPDCK